MIAPHAVADLWWCPLWCRYRRRPCDTMLSIDHEDVWAGDLAESDIDWQDLDGAMFLERWNRGERPDEWRELWGGAL